MQTSSIVQSYINRTETFKDAFSNKWSFISFEDAGEDWQESRKFRCQCGRTLKYRYTLKYEGSLEELSSMLTNDQKKEIENNGNLIYFGETCFGHKILGLSQDKSDKLEKSVRHIRNLTSKYNDDEAVKRALNAQRSLIEALRAVHAKIPVETELMDKQDIPLMKDQLDELKEIRQEYLKKQKAKEQSVATALDQQGDDSWTAFQNFARGTELAHTTEEKELISYNISKEFIDKDTDFQMKMRTTYDELSFGSALSAVDISFEIERKCIKSYGYFSSGRPKLYTELLALLLALKEKGLIQMISGDINDFVFKKSDKYR
ncbi:hypothetical protein ACFP7A_13050 [Sporolactobacillus kofuensis]|uniref:Uncharacterized protein n=1 Tax=Sporolactobacillus kofuensis TaxID=269672 RepID=A0ABW1WJJ4_9BACL|nr:hypothetical protein [Sporolactobacillus kofuensis]MCO7176977.1 hypothetical protein [Sporolactobacillus kofuensis]